MKNIEKATKLIAELREEIERFKEDMEELSAAKEIIKKALEHNEIQYTTLRDIPSRDGWVLPFENRSIIIDTGKFYEIFDKFKEILKKEG